MIFNHRLIIRTISMLLFFEGIAMGISSICGFLNGEMHMAWVFLILATLGISIGIMGRIINRDFRLNIRTRESYYIVLVSWLTVILYGILPFMLCGRGYTFGEALFESVASWTTCSANVIDIDTMPKSLILWKAIANWLGGIGVVIITIQIISTLGISGEKLAKAEIPGPVLEKTKPRMRDTAKVTFTAYALISFAEFILLLMGGIPLFDALINTMSSISTSGVMNYQGSVAAHFTPYIKCVLVIFSVIASMNFIIFIRIAGGRIKEAALDMEFRVYLISIFSVTFFIMMMLRATGIYEKNFNAFINALLATVSYGSTTGFSVENVTGWPSVCKVCLFAMMLVGGCANSTSGGIKVIRSVVFFKIIKKGFYSRIHPRAVKPIMIRNNPVKESQEESISGFILLFFGIYLISCMILSLENLDMETTLTAPAALFTNTGTGFGLVENGDYSMLSEAGKIYSAVLMLAGRLEMYAIVILFSRTFWKDDRSGRRYRF